MVARATSALGEAVGKLFETAVLETVRSTVEDRRHSIRPARLRNGTGNIYQIDVVVFDAQDRPVIIIDPKYIRYTKHNRDKGSWLCVAHYNLRKTHHSIRKSIAVLAGRWSAPSRDLIRSFGVEVIEVPFEDMATTLGRHGVEFDWPEAEGERVARASLQRFTNLDDDTRLGDRDGDGIEHSRGTQERSRSGARHRYCVHGDAGGRSRGALEDDPGRDGSIIVPQRHRGDEGVDGLGVGQTGRASVHRIVGKECPYQGVRLWLPKLPLERFRTYRPSTRR